MTRRPKSSPWDFGDALKLLQHSQDRQEPPEHDNNVAIFTPIPDKKTRGALGDFSGLWKALGTGDVLRESNGTDVNSGLPPLFTEAIAEKDHAAFLDPSQPIPPGPTVKEESYVSDGGYNPARKSVSWKQPDILDLFETMANEPTTATSDEGPGESSAGEGPATKTKGKGFTKAERRAAKAAARALREERAKAIKAKMKAARLRKTASDVESEAEVRRKKKPSPAYKASKHMQQNTGKTLQPPSVREKGKGNGGSPKKSKVPKEERQDIQASKPLDSSPNPHPTQNDPQARISAFAKLLPSIEAKLAKAEAQRVSTPQHGVFGGYLVPSSVPQPAKKLSAQTPQPQYSHYFENVPPIAGPVFAPSTPLPNQEMVPTGPKYPYSLPAGPYTPMHQPRTTLFNPVQEQSQPLTPLGNRARPQFSILEREERELQLFLRLIHVFGEDKKWLTKPVPLADHNASPTGIHVFVDFSNIWIGFMEYLRHIRQPPHHPGFPNKNISFDSLVLLLERKRPVAKRVLAGSYPLLPAMELAKAIGYETNILDKVYKARELTEKQRRYQSQSMHLNERNALGTQGSSSSPSTPMHAPEKWVEQGVDEVLHLKIMESIVDADRPGRMVIATGDGSKAEYSEGFMRMIVRALKRGWTVELVAFSQSIMKGYLSPEFSMQWQGRFKVICLDEWAEYLLDT